MKQVNIPVPMELLDRICKAFLEMQQQGATTADENLFEDLDAVLARFERSL